MGVLTTVAVVAGVAALGSAIVGAVEAGEERDAAREAMNNALAEIKAVGAPPDYAREIIYEKFKQAGLLTPEVEKQINLGASKIAKIADNENTKNAQLKALDQMQQRAKGGFTAEDKAAINQAKLEIANQNQAQQSQIIQSLAQRGMGGAGAELAARLGAQQQGSNLLSQQGMQLGADASRNALEAARMSGTFAGQIGQEQFERDLTRAEAEDAVNKFNIENAMGRQQRNIDRSNLAQEYNIKRQQYVSDLNVQQQNQEYLRQRDAERQRWLDSLGLAQAKAGQQTNLSNMHMNAAAGVASDWANIGSGFSDISGGAAKGAKKGSSGGAAAPASNQNASVSTHNYWGGKNPYSDDEP